MSSTWNFVTALALKNESHAPTRCMKEFDDVRIRVQCQSVTDGQTDRFAKTISRFMKFYEMVGHNPGTNRLKFE